MDDIYQWLPQVFVALALVFIAPIAALFMLRLTSRPVLVSYKVAVLGLPRAGKTSLIGAIFDEIYNSRLSRHILVTGEKTITRVSRIISLLEQGKPLPPTHEGDIFSFRFVYNRQIIIFNFRYEFEIADFPGEYTKTLFSASEDDAAIDSDESFLVSKDYLSWVTFSKVLIFVIDADEFLRDETGAFAADMRSKIRSTWQAIQEMRADKGLNASPLRVALVFTKCDVLASEPWTEHETIEARAARLHLEDDDLKNGIDYLHSEFSGLIDFFKASTRNFSVHFTSSYARGQNGRLGMRRLLSIIVPQGSSEPSPKLK